MIHIPLTPERQKLATRLVWFETPVEALADPLGCMAYAFARATREDMKKGPSPSGLAG